ncbi:MAG: filamentous hemagglutinin N-terminal domain-containing protein [Elainellaceae cyanobacterium]
MTRNRVWAKSGWIIRTLSGVAGAGVWVSPGLTQSLIVPDETLGEERSVVIQDFNGQPIEVITGGARRVQNLFHSFEEFNVDEGRGAYFNSPEGIANIFSRVTGGNPSNILGVLGVDGAANLFFLNPNGILFGPNASLDIEGSFTGSTAESLMFPDGSEFSATNPGDSSLLTVSVPLGLQYGANPPGSTIMNRGTLETGQNLTLAGDRLDLQGQLFAGGNLSLLGTDSVQIRDTVENPFIAASLGEMLVQGDRTVDIFALSHPDSGLFSGGNMTLRSANPLGGDAHYWSGGDFLIEQLDGSLGDLQSPDDPVIRSLGNVSFNNYFGNSLHILAGGTVTVPGTIFLVGRENGVVGENFLVENIQLSNGTTLEIDGNQQPTVDIRAGVSPEAIGAENIPENTFDSFFFSEFEFPLPIFENPDVSPVTTGSDITIGSIITLLEIEAGAPLIFVSNQYQPNDALVNGNVQIDSIDLTDTTDFGFVGGGDVVIDARGDIVIADEIDTISSLRDSGDITLLADGSVILDDALLTSSARGVGDGGNIFIQASEDVSLSGLFQGILNNVNRNAEGKGGDTTINADTLSLRNAATIDASTFGNDDAGQIVIDVGDAITLESGSVIFNNIEEDGVGDTGGIEIRAGSLSLEGASRITATVDGRGNAGDIFIQADDFISLEGNNSFFVFVPTANISSQFGSEANGTVGNIILDADTITLDGAVVSTSTFGNGSAGNISIRTDGNITFTNSAAIFSSVNSGSRGEGGAISIDAETLTLDQSLIQTIVRGATGNLPPGEGNSGSISIRLSGDLNVVGQRDIDLPLGIVTSIAFDVTEGVNSGDPPTAGDIQITARDLFISDEGQFRSVLDRGSVGEAGDIDLRVRSLTMSDAAILSSTLGNGNAGNIHLQVSEAMLLTDGSVIFSGVIDGGNGDSGSIDVEAGTLSVTDGQIGTSVGVEAIGFDFPPAQGNAGDINVTIDGAATFDGQANNSISSRVSSELGGRGGNITFRSDSLSMNNSAQFNSETNGIGPAGNIAITTGQMTLLNGSGIESTTTSAGTGGDIMVDVDRLILHDGSFLLADALEGSTERAGNLTVNAADLVEIVGTASDLDASGLYAQTRADGDAGNLRVTTGHLSIRDGGTISVETSGRGNGGNLVIDVTNSLEILGGSPDQSFSSSINAGVEEGASGDGGNISITTGQLVARDGGFIASSAEQDSAGNAGSVFVRASDSIELVGKTLDRDAPTAISVAVEPGATGNTGDLTIETQRLSIRDGAGVLAQNLGTGQAGTIRINATDSINVIGSANEPSLINASIGPFATGETGNIFVDTGRLRLRNGGQIFAGTFGQVNAGDISVRATDLITISGATLDGLFPSGIVATSIPLIQGDAGQGGNINVQTRNLIMRERGEISASTFGQASAGDIFIRADNTSLDRSIISTTIEQNAIAAQPSNITIDTRSLRLNNDANITASTAGRGRAGNITIENADIVFLAGESAIASEVAATGRGQGGNLRIQADSLNLTDQSSITASTEGQGRAGNIFITGVDLSGDRASQIRTATSGNQNAGDITVVISNSVELDGSDTGIFANTERDSGGDGGDIAVHTQHLSVTNEAEISSESLGEGIAGNVEIQADEKLQLESGRIATSAERSAGGAIEISAGDIFLSGTSDITTNVASGTDSGGNIGITAVNVQLRDDSDITTNVSGGTGDGGNIAIAANAVIAFDDSDIISSAPLGSGGNITLDTLAFFGDGFSLASLDANPDDLDNNDRVDINATGAVAGIIALPDISFIQNSLSELPEAPIDTESLIANSCIARNETDGTFIITGAGGLPDRPGETSASDYPTGDVRPIPDNASSTEQETDWQPGDPIVEPQGVYQLPSGELILSHEC